MIYHSHTATEAYPSRTDIAYASEPDAHYVLVSHPRRDGESSPVVPVRGRGPRGSIDGDGHRGRTGRTSSYGIDAEPSTERTRASTTMAIEVRIPTILRTYTGGEKAVDGSGRHADAPVDDLESHHPGLRTGWSTRRRLRRFVNVYVNDEDVRFLGGLETPVKDGDR